MSRTALIVIDVQNEYFTGSMPITYPVNSFQNILSAMDTAHQYNMPIILVKHLCPPDAPDFRPGSHWAEIHSEVLKKGYDVIIEKHLASSFHETPLEGFLKDHNIDTVVIAGYMTQMCCDTTARHASHLGYKVQFLSDATGTLAFNSPIGAITAKQLHETTLITQSIFFSEVLSLEAWQNKLADDSTLS